MANRISTKRHIQNHINVNMSSEEACHQSLVYPRKAETQKHLHLHLRQKNNKNLEVTNQFRSFLFDVNDSNSLKCCIKH